MFAFTALDPKVAKIRVNQVTWPVDGAKEYTEIPLIECQELDEFKSNGDIKTISEIFDPYVLSDRYQTESFICPNSDSMYVQGGYESDEFSYLQIDIMGCELPED